MTSAWPDESGTDYLDTVTLLQEEIARLEAELRQRDEAVLDEPSPRPLGDPATEDAGARQIHELTTLLTERDETIGLLCEQLAALEEAGAARAAEWEQMDRWVRELEERIEREGTRTSDPDENESFRQTEVLRERLESRERAWEAERAHFEREIAGLRSRLTDASGQADDHARAALEAENHRLRDECRRLAGFEAAEAEAQALRERSNATDGRTRGCPPATHKGQRRPPPRAARTGGRDCLPPREPGQRSGRRAGGAHRR